MSATPTDASEAARARGAYAWWACAVLCVVYVVCLVDRFLMSIVIVPLKAEMHLTDTQLGLVAGLAFALLYCLAGIPAGRLVDITNRRNLIAGGCTVWTLATAASAFAHDFQALFLCRVVVGIGEAVLVPAALSLLADYFARDKLGRAVGAFQTAVPIGKFVAFAGGGALLQYFTIKGGWASPMGLLDPWRVLFLAAAAPGFLAVALVLTLREPVRRAAFQVAGAAKGVTEKFLPYLRRHRAASLLHGLGWMPAPLLGNVIIAWAPSFYVRQFHLTIFESATLLGVLGLIGGGIGYNAGGLLMDFLNRRGVRGAAACAMAIGLVVSVPAGVLFALSPSLPLSAVGLTVAMIGVSMGGGSPPLAGLQLMTPVFRRGIVTAVAFSSIGLISVGLGPVLTGLLSDHVFHATPDRALGLSIVAIALGCAALGIPAALLARAPVQRASDEAAAREFPASA